MKIQTRDPLESKVSKIPKNKISTTSNNLTITSVDICPMCHQAMRKMQIGHNKVDAYVCVEDRIALPVEDQK